MKYSGIHFLIPVFFSILLLGTFSRTNDLDTMKATLHSILERLQKVGDNAQRNIQEFGGQAVQRFYSLGEKAKNFIDDAKSVLRNKMNVDRANVYAYESTVVRVGNDASTAEREFLVKRHQKVRAALEEMLEESCEEKAVPTISIIMSGGGYRAMLGAIGFLAGAEKIGLLDATTYLSTLSGSTWAVAPWIVTGMSLTGFKEYIRQTITRDLEVETEQQGRLISDMLRQKIVFREPITMVDMYGVLLANRLLADFGDRRQLVRLSDIHERIKNADYPYPIFTAIDGRMAVAHDAPWFEFTPHEVGCADYGVYVPTWAYGRKFNAGKSVNFAPEQSLGFQLGTFGSAFGVHVGYVWNLVHKKLSDSWFKRALEKFVKENVGKRLFWAEIPNYMFGMKNQELSERKYLKMVDAGLAFNLPYPPVSGQRVHRKPDILIFCDMSATGKGQPLMKAEQYARSRNLPFPVIDYTDISYKTISVFKDATNSTVPVVIYMPRFCDWLLWEENKSDNVLSQYGSIEWFDIESCLKKGFCRTSNFKYSREQSQQLIDLMEFNVVANKDIIIEAIKGVIDRQ